MPSCLIIASVAALAPLAIVPPIPPDPPDQSAPAQPSVEPTKTPASTPDAAPKSAPNQPTQPARPPQPGLKSDPGHDLVVPAVAYPHPLITEVLFAVPTGPEGDANKDGTRQVSGDEFVEIVNPHDHSIDLRGYVVTDGAPNVKTQLRFTFPSILVPPHGVIVLFNGHDSKIPGPIGSLKSAPPGPNDHFASAAVFAVRPASSRVSFSNAGDAACLLAPDHKPIQRVRWGKADDKSGGTGFLLDEIAPTTSKASVQRDGFGKDAQWKIHTDVDATPFSPGVYTPFAGTAPAPLPASPSQPTKPPLVAVPSR